MAPLTETVNPVKVTDVKVYHCGNYLGVWRGGVPADLHWCRKCHQLISPTISVGD